MYNDDIFFGIMHGLQSKVEKKKLMMEIQHYNNNTKNL